MRWSADVPLRKMARLPMAGPLVERLRNDPRDFLLERLPRDSAGAEIGTHEGDFAARILHVVRPRLLHLVDPWHFMPDPAYEQALYGGKGGIDQQHMDERYQRVLRRFSADIERGRVVVHRAASATAAAEIGDGSLDFVYIDGNHLYEFVLEDLKLYSKKIRRGGLLAGDDYVPGGWWQGGVKRAVDEFVECGRVQVEVIRSRQFLLRVV